METLDLDTAAVNNKKLKLVENDKDPSTLDMNTTDVVDSDMMEDDTIDPPNESGSEDLEELDNASSYYESEEEFVLYDETLSLQAQFDAADLPPGVEASVPWLEEAQNQVGDQTDATLPSTDPALIAKEEQERRDEEILNNYRNFKCFDTIQDFSDHRFANEPTASTQPGRDWAKTIQNEWRMLEKDLPETIFVRVYEERMDLMRAVIIGANTTPYHDGLFFFDCFFPSDYPKVPPNVLYHSGGLRLNPNLYNCGKVCLSLLGTWSGRNSENWIPGKSTMLQVLLSIQALVLNEKPYFNEPGYERTAGLAHGEKRARDYNEETFVLSCKTMQFTLHNPPKYFEDFVCGHFRVRAHSILEACREYLKGAQVGSYVDVEEPPEEEEEEQDILNDEKTALKKFRKQLSIVVGNLIPLLIKNGAKDCEKYIPLGDITRKAPLKI
ncbi:(E3-independent) E2 ubiquitin-conjugating enzyme [Ranunculus cassubicifolius]